MLKRQRCGHGLPRYAPHDGQSGNRDDELLAAIISNNHI
jgi:hypothetical protein